MRIPLDHGSIDLEARLVTTSGGVETALTAQEADLLAWLHRNKDRPVARDELLREVWGYSVDLVTRAVDIAVRRVRTKIEPDPKRPRHLVTVRGEGYRLVTPEVPDERGPTDAFFARSEALHALRSARLVTVTGPPGIGKTRLLAQALPDLQIEVRGPVDRAVAAALEVPVARVTDALAARTGILALDDVDVTDASIIERWLHATSLTFWTTGPSALGCPGELRLELGPLDVEDAAALFRARATAVFPAFAIDDHVLGSILERLDGNPLAIELAAARVTVLSPSMLLRGLEQRFRLLRPLHAAIDLSWSALQPAEQDALASCSVFAGPFSFDSADAVVQVEAWTLDWLQDLREKSLIRVVDGHDNDVRYVLDASVRDFAATHRPDGVLERHRDHFLTATVHDEDLADLLAIADHFPDTASTLADRADAMLCRTAAWERRLALLRTLDPAPRHTARMAHSLRQLADFDGARALLEGDHPAIRLERARLQLDAGEDADLDGLDGAEAEHLRGWVAQLRGDFAGASVHHDRALPDAETDELRCRIRYAQALCLQAEGEVAGAIALLHRVLGDYEAAGDHSGAGHTLSTLGTLHAASDELDEAATLYRRALRINRRAGYRRQVGIVLGNLGNLLLRPDSLDEATDYLRQALAIATDLGNERTMGLVSGNLGVAAHARGDLDAALSHLRQTALLTGFHGDWFAVRRAAVLADRGRADEAAALLDAHADTVSAVPLGGRMIAIVEAHVARARGLSGELGPFEAEVSTAAAMAWVLPQDLRLAEYILRG